jgi:hypothetical protein
MQGWDAWVADKGGRVLEHGKVEFAGHEQDLAAVVANETVFAPLSDFALIRARGEDALAFLQGQLSSDLNEVGAGCSQYSSYSNAKGRMQASFLIWQHLGDYYLMVSADLAAVVHKRLSMFVLRSKLKLELVTDQWRLVGIAGPQAVAKLGEVFESVPSQPHLVAASSGGVVQALPGGAFLVALPANVASGALETLTAGLTLIGSEAWGLWDIRAGRPWVTLPTYEQFVAQMANMELIGAVNFKKGCFPGQEIIARTQYLGKLKKRLFHVLIPQAAKAGDELFSPAMRDQSIGMVVNACRIENGQVEALAVVQINAWESGVHLANPEGAKLTHLDLPYALGEEDKTI